MPALNVGINSTFEQQRVVVNTLAVDVNSIITGQAGLSTYSPIAGVSSNTVRFDNQLPSYYLNYANLTGTPTVLSDFSNDIGFVTSGYFSSLNVLSIGGTITSQNVISAFTGNLAGTASTALKIPVAESGDNNVNYDIPFINGAYTPNADHNLQVDSGALRFNPSSNTLSVQKVAATTFEGALSGDATGLSGSPDITVNSLLTGGNVTASQFIGALQGSSTGVHYGNVVGDVTGTASSATAALGMYETADVITTGIVSATRYFGDGSQLTGITGGGAGGVRVEEEGSIVGAAQTINFVGSAVTASFANSKVTIEITDTDTEHWSRSGSHLYHNDGTASVSIGANSAEYGSILTVGSVGTSGTAVYVNGDLQATDKITADNFEVLNGNITSITLDGSSGDITANGDILSRDINTIRDIESQGSLKVGSGGTVFFGDGINGKVGLNTQTPNYLLDINGELGVRGPTYFTDTVNLSDNTEIRVGDNTDLKIYHDNVNTHIAEQGQGSLIVRGSTVSIRNDVDTQDIAKFSSSAGAKLYYANTERFETLSIGATTFGDHYATKFYGDGSALTNVTPIAAGGFSVQSGGSNVGTAATLNFTGSGVSPSIVNGIAIIDIASGGGGGSSSPGFFNSTQTNSGIHTTALHVGIGTTNPQTQIQVGDSYGVQSFRGSWSATPGTARTDVGGWTIADTDFKSAEYTLWFNFQDGRLQSQKVLAMHDGSTAYVQQFAIMNTGSAIINVDAEVSSGDFVLKLVPESGITGIVTYIVRRETML